MRFPAVSSHHSPATSSRARARFADSGGMLSGLKTFVGNHAPANFAIAFERSGVTPAALGAGYVVFFTYSALIGVFALMLSLAVLRRQEREERG